MSPKLNIFGTSAGGVNVDKNPIELEDGELTKAQNCISAIASDGSIQKREGLVKYNSVTAAGAIMGAIGVPLQNTTPIGSLMVATWNTSGSPTDPQTWNSTADAGTNWVLTGGPNAFDANASVRSPANLWSPASTFSDQFDQSRMFTGRPGVTYKNRLYYASNNYTPGTTDPPLRMWDGVTDYWIADIPPSRTASAKCYAVLNMIVGGSKIYMTVYDGGSYAANGIKVRVLSLDPENGVIQLVGERFETSKVPFALAWHDGALWTRTWTGGISTTGLTYTIRPEFDTAWTLDETNGTSDNPDFMLSFQGQLYMAMVTDATSPAHIDVRSPLGVFSVAKAVSGADVSPTFIGYGTANHFGAMAEFKGNLYAAYYNPADGSSNRIARIYKFDGTTWTVPYTPALNASTAVPYHNALVTNGKLYFVSSAYNGVAASAYLNKVIVTSDGVTWTDISTGLTNFASGVISNIKP